MRIYLASRYSRRVELCGYRNQLTAAGHTVQAEWLNGDHQISDSGKPLGESGESLVEGDDGSTNVRAAALRSKFAQDDFRDVAMCELLIAFTEPPRSSASRGGRHVELGLALGMMKRVFVVGYRENIFCWLEDVQFFETWEECLDWIIFGGESDQGSPARYCNVEWIRDGIQQCRARGITPFVKQLGSHDFQGRDKAGADPEEWPFDLRVREFPTGVKL